MSYQRSIAFLFILLKLFFRNNENSTESPDMKKALIAVVCILISFAALAGYLNYRARRMPAINPGNFTAAQLPAQKKNVAVCVGDSITHGAVSCNYVDILSGRDRLRGYTFVNAGINSELAYNAVQRADGIMACNPVVITILIGTNDAAASLSPGNQKRYRQDMDLPRLPDRGWYRENLRLLIQKFKTGTRARIAVFSLPPIGEERESAAYKRAQEYSTIVKEVALSEKITYLPLNERMDEIIAKRGMKNTPVYNENMYLMYKGIVQHYLLRMSYDEISSSNNFLLITDTLHLNCVGAALMADMVENFVLER
jgi:lysophospholipase L1-like esterase